MRASGVVGACLLLAGCGSVASMASPDAGAPDAACDGGACPSACAAAGGTLCDGRCVDLASDHDACGQCGHRCDLDAVCMHGVCTPSCAPPLTPCGDQCVDLGSDPRHCGSCASDCGASHLCAGGSCAAYCPLGDASAIGPGNRAAAVGDVDGDGIADVVAVDGGASGLSALDVYLGRGDGTFRALAAQPLGLDAIALALADVNGDGSRDVALLTGSGNVSLGIYLNVGGGRFSPGGAFTAGIWSGALALADLDGDGAPDAVIANEGGSQGSGWVGNDVTVLFNDGGASFSRAVHLQAGVVPSSVAVADLDGDGARDIAATNLGDGASAGPALNLFFGDGHGGFAAAQPISLQADGGLAAADLDGDGRLDLAVDAGSSVLVLLNRGQRRFAAPVPYAAPYTAGVATGDMNGDGHVDLVLGGEGLAVLFNRGDGTFEPAAACAPPVDGGSYAAVSPIVVSLRSDAVPDVVTVDDSTNAGDVTAWLQPSR